MMKKERWQIEVQSVTVNLLLALLPSPVLQNMSLA